MTDKLLFSAILFSIMIALSIVYLIKKNKLSEEYSTIWLGISFFIFLSSLFSKHILLLYAKLKGDQGTGPEVLLFFALIFVLYFLILISVKLSQYRRNLVRISQEMGILKQRIQELEKS